MLNDIIIQKIKDGGPISFRDFMEMALYYPELGYYTSSNDKIGVEGDYYTSPNLSPLFGMMIGRQLEEMWNILGRKAFTVVEYGAGTGTLCRDILNYLKQNNTLYDMLTYCIIEKSPAMREKEQAFLKEKVYWYSSIEEIPPITGCILSNELVDNFAVHQVVMQQELMEVFVDYQNGFTEVLQPATKALKKYLIDLNIVFPKGFRTEINLQAIAWIKGIAKTLKKGYVLTIDYGYTSEGLYAPYKSSGTLMCYNKHRITDNPYKDLGGQDITSHVNFSALVQWGLKYGLQCCGFTNQANFLLGLGFKEYLRTIVANEENIVSAIRKELFLTQTLLMDMGFKFKVLIQQKGIVNSNLLGLCNATNEVII